MGRLTRLYGALPAASRLPHSSLLLLYLLSAPLTIPLVYCCINSFRRASSGGLAMTRRRKRIGGRGGAKSAFNFLSVAYTQRR